MYSSVSYDFTSTSFFPSIEATGAHDDLRPYYTFRADNLTCFFTDDQCRQLMEVLASRPTLPKSDALPTVSEMSGLLDSSADIFAPECPDSPDGKHHAALIGSEEDYYSGPLPCHYCGEKPEGCANASF